MKINIGLLSLMMIFTVCCNSPLTFAENSYSYFDDFSVYEPGSYSGYNVNLQDNWRTGNESEQNAQALVPVNFKNGKLNISTANQYTTIKYTTGNAQYFPTVVFNKSTSGLGECQKISLTAQKTHPSDMWGVRFLVHNGNGGLNYYTLFFGGMYTNAYPGNGYLTWGLYKSTDGNVETLKEKVRTASVDEVDGYMGTGTASLEIEVRNGNINWNLKYGSDGVSYEYTEQFTDTNPFDITDINTAVHLYTAGGDTETRVVSFDDFLLESRPDSAEYTEDTIELYSDALCGVTPVDGVYELPGKTQLCRFVSNNTAERLSVLVSNDKVNWLKICELNGNENYLNRYYTEKYKYLKIQGNGSVNALAKFDGTAVHLMSNEQTEIFYVYNGVLDSSEVEITYDDLIRRNGRIYSLKEDCAKSTIKFSAKEHSKSITLTNDLLKLICKKTSAGIGYNVEIYADNLKAGTYLFQTVTYNKDGSLGKITLIPLEYSNGAVVNIKNNNYVGEYVKVRITDTKFLPYTDFVTLY